MNVLSIDVGGSHVKILVAGRPPEEARRIESGPHLGPVEMVAAVRELARGWSFDAVSIGFPGPVSRAWILERHDGASVCRASDFNRRAPGAGSAPCRPRLRGAT